MMGFGGFGMVFALVVLVAVVALAVWSMGELFPRMRDSAAGWADPWHSSPSNNALDILKERYARGEISKVEYDDMRNHLQLQRTVQEEQQVQPCGDG